MSEPFISEIRIFAGNFAPRGWAFCDGQELPIANNTALFSLIGTIYGGDGRTNTALPNMQGRAPIHSGHGPGLTQMSLGERWGSEVAGLSVTQIPSHTHAVNASLKSADTNEPGNSVSLAQTGFLDPAYQTDVKNNIVNLDWETIGKAGGSEYHDNMQPYLTLNFIIALIGMYPTRD